MTRHRSNAPTSGPSRRTRGGAPPAGGRRVRPRSTAAGTADLSDEELRALADEDVDPDEAARVAHDAVVDEQEASDHDRDTPRDRIEGLRYGQDDG